MDIRDKNYVKYLKYKNKYLTLKNLQTIQIGGGKPDIFNMKNVNIFPTEENNFHVLNPFNGFVWFSSELIRNYYSFDGTIFGKIVKDFFIIIGDSNELRVTKHMITYFKPFDMGMIIAQCFLYFYGKGSYIEVHTGKMKQNKLLYLKNESLSESPDLNKTYFKIMQYAVEVKLANASDPNAFMYFLNIMLAIMWYIANDKDGIAQYYMGIKSVFTEQQFDPDKYNIDSYLESFDPADHYMIDEIEPSSQRPGEWLSMAPFETLASMIYYHHNQIQLNEYETVKLDNITTPTMKLNNISFSDCGETTLRNLFKILFYRNQAQSASYDTEMMKKMNVHQSVIDYFNKYNSLQLQNTDQKIKFKGNSLNAREAWAVIVSNIDGIKYAQQTTDSHKTFNFEIGPLFAPDGKTENIMQVIFYLFNIRTIDEFSKLINRINENDKYAPPKQSFFKSNFEEDGSGSFTFRVKYGVFRVNSSDTHYYIDKAPSPPLDVKIDHIKNNRHRAILLALNNKLTFDMLASLDIYKPYMYLNLNNDGIDEINLFFKIIDKYGHDMNPVEYSRFINHLYDKIKSEEQDEPLDPEELKRYRERYRELFSKFSEIKLLLSKIDHNVFKKIDFEPFKFNTSKPIIPRSIYFNTIPTFDNIKDLQLRRYSSEEINALGGLKLNMFFIYGTSDKLQISDTFPSTERLIIKYMPADCDFLPTDFYRAKNIQHLILHNDNTRITHLPPTLKTLKLFNFTHELDSKMFSTIKDTDNFEIVIKRSDHVETVVKSLRGKYKIRIF